MTTRNRTTSASAADLQAQLRAAQLKRQQAEQAEQARLAAERKHAEEIAAENTRIAALQGQLAAAALDEAAQRDQEHNAENMMRFNDVLEALNALSPDILQGVQAAWDAMSDQIYAQRDNAMKGLGQYQRQAVIESNNQPSPNHKHAYQQNAMMRAGQKFTTPLPIWGAFVMWISRATNDRDKLFRQAVGYMFFGRLFEPPKNINEGDIRGQHARDYWPN